jgi:hypothetical protein
LQHQLTRYLLDKGDPDSEKKDVSE